MKFDEVVVINSNRNRVWDLIADREAFVRCIPGCESVEVKDDETVLVGVRLKIGFISSKWRVEVSMANVTPPEHMEAVGRGLDDGLSSSFHMYNTLDLEPIGPDQTVMKYTLDVKLLGKLGMIGSGVIKIKANDIAKGFAQNLLHEMERRTAQSATT